MSILVHLLLAWAYLAGAVVALFLLHVASVEYRQWRQRARRSTVIYLPLERAVRAHPSNVRRIDTRIRVGGSR